MPSTPSSPGTPRTSLPRTLARVVLGGFLLFAGTAHLTFARADFQAQVPTWLPLDADFVVLASGVVEVLLGLALIVAWRWRVAVGFTVAAFFVAVLPGNISQYVTGTDAFGLDTDAARLIRLPFQVLLIGLALWSTAAWRDRRSLLTPLRRRDAATPRRRASQLTRQPQHVSPSMSAQPARPGSARKHTRIAGLFACEPAYPARLSGWRSGTRALS